MEDKIFDYAYKTIFKYESKKHNKKNYNDKLFCHFCQKKITRSCKSAHEITELHKKNVEEKKKYFINNFKKIFLNNQST